MVNRWFTIGEYGALARCRFTYSRQRAPSLQAPCKHVCTQSRKFDSIFRGTLIRRRQFALAPCCDLQNTGHVPPLPLQLGCAVLLKLILPGGGVLSEIKDASGKVLMVLREDLTALDDLDLSGAVLDGIQADGLISWARSLTALRSRQQICIG